MHLRRRVVVVVGAIALLTVATAFGASGAITQPGGTAGCISEDGSGPCADGHGLADAVDAVTVSPDGKSVYATTHSAVARFKRNTSTGAITQPAGAAGCVSEDGSGPCADGHALTGGADAVAVSPNGKSVYVASYTNNAVLRFKRNKHTGAITQPAGAAGCVSEDGSSSCADGHGLSGVAWVTVSPDGKNVYAASTISNAIVRFKRDKQTGAISEPSGNSGCVSEDGSGPCADGHALLDALWVGADPDGKNLYVASLMSNAVAILKLHGSGAISQPAGSAGCVSEDGSGPCADGRGLSGPFALAISPNGKSVYASTNASNAVARFNRNRSTGALTQPGGSAGCVSEDGSGPCADGHALAGADSVLVSPDGKNVYAASGNAVATFKRNKATGAISEATGVDSCISDDGSGPCIDGHGLAGIFTTAISDDGKSIYVASLDSDALARIDRAP